MRLVFFCFICITEGQFFIGPYDVSKIQPEGDVELRDDLNGEKNRVNGDLIERVPALAIATGPNLGFTIINMLTVQ